LLKASRIAAIRILVVIIASSVSSLHGQTRPEADAPELAIKMVRELGGKLRYADEFKPSKDYHGYLYPNRNPLAEYCDMKWPMHAAAPEKGMPGENAADTGQRQVVQIDLSGTRPTDEAIARLAAYPQLRVLLLNGATVSDENLAHLAPLRQLEVLDLSSTQVTGAGLRHLAELTRLKELRLIETKVDDEGLRWLASLKDLETLTLSDTRVGDRGLEHLAANPKISELRIDDAGATEAGVDRFRNLHPQCRVFHLHWLDPLKPPHETPESKEEEYRRYLAPDNSQVTSSKDLFKRGHPRVARVFDWDGRIVAQCSVPGKSEPSKSQPLKTQRFFTIDASAASSAPLSLPGADEILQLATVGPSEPVALCVSGGKRVLLCKEKDAWATRDLPDEALRSTILAMEADAHDLVLLTPDEYLWRKDGQWTVKKHTGGDRFFEKPSMGHTRYLVANGSLYRAIDAGEFGGGLYRLDLIAGKWETEKIGSPICDVKVDPKGRLWAVMGLRHMTGIHGAVWMQQSDGWKAIVSIDHFQRRKIGWNLGYTDPQAIAFDAEGRIYVVTYEYGICRYEDRRWQPLIQRWPGDGDASLHLVGSNMAVIGTYTSGVFLCQLDMGAVRQVLLVPPDADGNYPK
jgi:hypothetical protein